MAKVIEFYIPEQFRKQGGKRIPPEQDGEIIPFPASEKKSATHEGLPALTTLRQIREWRTTEEFEGKTYYDI